MGTFAIDRAVPVPSQRMWDVITDWDGYSRWLPLTTMRLDDGPAQVGWSFAGLTGLGRLRFRDAMVITDWAPPAEQGSGTLRLVKVGRLLAGWAEVRVLPTSDGEQTSLMWRENIVLRPVLLGRFLAPVTDRLNRAMFSRMIDRMAAEAVGDPGRHT